MLTSNHKRIALLAIVVSLVLTVLPATTEAAQLTPRSLALGSSLSSVATTHTFTFTVPTTGTVGSILFQYCTTALGACTMPSGLSTSSATLTGQTGATGFSIVNTTNGSPYLTRATLNINSGTALSYTLGNVQNPSSTNTTFWVRITTYSSVDTSGLSTDDGVVAASTATGVVITGYMPESIIFCVGTSGTDCSNMTGSTVDLGVFSPLSTVTATSVMSASTNAASGYVITVVGPTLTSGLNSITPMGTQTLNSAGTATSAIGTSQFGTNLRLNTTPTVGADVSGAGTGTGVGGYNSVNNFRFFSGDTVASVAVPSNPNLYTNSYLVNVSADQAAGTYSATLTYICTGLF